MRVFWSILAILLVVGIGLVVAGRDDAGAWPAESDAPTMPVEPVVPEPMNEPAPDHEERAAATQEAPVSEPVLVEEEEVPPTGAPAPSLDEVLGLQGDADDEDPTRDARERDARELDERLAAESTPTPGIEFAPIEGAGTREDPFVVSWDLLGTASDTYRPRDGLRELPPDIERLDGEVVAVTGYYLKPWTAGDITEILLMQYLWDACCIGVPPSAFTAIEVTLASPLDSDRLVHGTTITLHGVLRIEPDEVKDWLLALYAMEEAEVRYDE